MPEKDPNNFVVAVNRHARHEFFILEKYEAGIELEGYEVKSVRAAGANLKEGYAHVARGELFLEGVHMTPYEHASAVVNPVRSRRLLMHRREIDRIEASIKQKGCTLVPLSLYFKEGRVKIELGLAKGKKAHDKRATIKKRETERMLAKVQRR